MRLGNGSGLAEIRQRLLKYLRERLLAERDRWALWLPVAMGGGVAVYFGLPLEPGPGVGLALLAGSAAALYVSWRIPARKAIALGLLAAALGFAAAELRTALVTAPMLNETLASARVEGRVLDVEFLAGGRRIRLGEVIIPGLVDPPAQLRLRLASMWPPLVPGDWIRLKANIGPPSRPVAPGSYDFRRDLFFDGIGGIGFALGRPRILDDDSFGGREPVMHRLWQGLADLRATIEGRMLATLPDRDTAGVAVSFVTGSQTAVPSPILLAMRNSGLAHLLSVSGLHVGLAVGILFFLVRAILALIPPVALNWPIKKWAAALALLGAGFYMLLSGASVPVVRSFLMAGIVLLAVIVDRQAISMRPVATAAVVVLLLWPDSVVGPSFQLSFAAIVALTATWEELSLYRTRQTGLVRQGLRWMFDLALSSLVATLATAAFGIYHFNRLTGYGVIANMLAVPMTGFWVMPWLILSLLLMPFGLEAWALQPAGWGISAILWTARTVAAWPGAVSLVPAMPPIGLAAISLGGLWLCLWRGRWRFAGLLGVAAGLAVIPFARPPDILVSQDAKLVAIIEADGTLRLSSRQADRFAASEWLRRVGQDRAFSWLDGLDGADPRLTCQQGDCRFRAAGRQVAILRSVGGFTAACAETDLVIALVAVSGACGAPVIDPARLGRNGGHAIWLRADGPLIESVREQQGSRPWVQPALLPDAGELDDEDQ
jgi:competence protein ComEC